MKGKRTTAQQKLTVALTHLENIIAEDNGRVPTEMALVRQQTGLQNAWEAYDTAHAVYLDLLEEDAVAGEVGGYQVLYVRHDALGKPSRKKKCFLLGIARKGGGGETPARIF